MAKLRGFLYVERGFLDGGMRSSRASDERNRCVETRLRWTWRLSVVLEGEETG